MSELTKPVYGVNCSVNENGGVKKYYQVEVLNY